LQLVVLQAVLSDGTVLGEATLPLISIARVLAEAPGVGEAQTPHQFKDWITLYVVHILDGPCVMIDHHAQRGTWCLHERLNPLPIASAHLTSWLPFSPP
jgi:hypothetical protein